MSNPETSHEPTGDQEIPTPEATKADTESAEFGNPGATNAKVLNAVPRETQAGNAEVVNAVFEIEAKKVEVRDIEANNAEFNDEAANKVRNKVGQPEVENREEKVDERTTNEERDQEKREEGATGGAERAGVIEGDGKENQEKAVEDEAEEEETMDPSEISDNLSAALQAIEDCGTFATSGNFSSAPSPVLSIDSIGIVGLPLSNRDAETIIVTATQAPFGHGERTVVNTDVRDTWELQPNQIQFLNPAWKSWIEKEVLAKAAGDLGIVNTAETVKCELYKVLLYKEGGHFLPHKDTEKATGMFGTLIVILPSLHTGGIVQLSHAGMQKEFDFGGPTSVTNTSYAAWYTDILHSVSPVTSGYRFALSYNMIHKGIAAVPRLPNTQAQVGELWRVLRTWNRNANDPVSPSLLVWILDHEYSEQALNSQKIEALKGADKRRGLVLLDLAKELGFEFYLAQIEYQKTGTVVDDDYCYGRRRRYGYGYGYDDDDDDDPEDKVMDDVIDETLTARNFINCKTGNTLHPDFSPRFGQEDCIPVGYWEGEEPDTKDYEGYTGNEEATLDYWYKRTAIIIWPSSIHAKVVGHLAYKWDSAAFLDRALWTQADISLGKRLRFGEDIITQLAASPEAPPYVYGQYGPQGKDKRYADELMAFALEEKRLDLFLKMVNVTQSTDIARMTEAANLFGIEGVRDIVQRCISNTKGIKNQLVAAIQFYRRQPEELKVIVKRLVDAASIPTEVKPEDLRGLLDLTGTELFQTCILPNLKTDYSRTAFWISLWKHHPDIDCINDTLPEVVHAHKTRIHLTKDGGHFTLSSQTLPLFSKVLEEGCTNLAIEIIEKIQAIPKPADAGLGGLWGRYSIALMATVKRVVQILQQHKVPVTAEPYANFIKKTLVNRILPTLGPRPRPGEDFCLQMMRAAGQPPCCPNCNAVDIFLSDPWQQTVSYHLTYPLREHLEQKLRGRRHIGVRNDPLPVQMYKQRNKFLGTITINKVGLSAADVIDKWDRVRAYIESSFIEIGDERTRKEVFGALFPIIQMGIRDYGMGWGKEMEEAAVLSEQEEQQMRAQRPQDRAHATAHATAGATDHHCEAGPPGGSNRTPRASLREASGNVGDSVSLDIQTTNVGRKRKRPTQVIDLTND